MVVSVPTKNPQPSPPKPRRSSRIANLSSVQALTTAALPSKPSWATHEGPAPQSTALPLSSNPHEIAVDSFDWRAIVCFGCHKLTCSVLLHLVQRDLTVNVLKLDAHNLRIKTVTVPNSVRLKYQQTSSAIEIHSQSGSSFPSEVLIEYETGNYQDAEPPLQWCETCVFSQGSLMGNRGLLPCQDMPQHQLTWSIDMQAPKGCTVITSADDIIGVPEFDTAEAICTCESCLKQSQCNCTCKGLKRHKFHSPQRAPIGTLALFIGPLSLAANLSSAPLPCRFCISCDAPEIAVAAEQVPQLDELVSSLLRAAPGLLGTYPFPRCDIVVLPPAFACLGLAHPNFLFLSCSLLAGNPFAPGATQFVTLAHELVHNWYGLNVGLADWNHEWLTEGIATYLEERVWARGRGLDAEASSTFAAVRAMSRWRTLKYELGNVREHFLDLAPQTDVSEKEVANGLDPQRRFSHVHYMKGYFLLRYLAQHMGIEQLDAFLAKFASVHAGGFVSSADFLTELGECLPDGDHQKLVGVAQRWLSSRDAPPELDALVATLAKDPAVAQAADAATAWGTTGKSPGERLTSDQLCLMLDDLVTTSCSPRLARAMNSLRNWLDIDNANVFVKYRWSELVVLRKCRRWYPDVARSLSSDQSMGIYLYGELILLGGQHFDFAESVFLAAGEQMDLDVRRQLAEMFASHRPEQDAKPLVPAKRNRK
eukprot:TRINITY_DN80489_c0_g1_i1.p1 TRINITY_DN80489_c0_g1~~TRINITY_DN80489_c0_g1_i1.p1  ORF type:complete len:707 (-),score=79.95 TRINITY_DN80489_c0_g1_i1:28-2148(-)